LNSWIATFSLEVQKDLIGRMKKGSSAQFKAAFIEVTLHEILSRSAYSIDVHPQLSNGKRLDFKASDVKGAVVAYLEVTSFAPSHSSEGAANRQSDIYNAIERARIPENCFLIFACRKTSNENARLKQLIADVEAWVEGAKEESDIAQTQVFDSNGWKIELTLRVLPRKRVDPRNIGIVFGGARYVSAPSEIRKALEEKTDLYGELDAPFIIAVADCKGELTGGDNSRDLIAALFGDEVVHVSFKEDGSHEAWDGRKRNGFWGSADNPKNQHVSAVALFPTAEIWSFSSERWQPVLVRNPWAKTSLPEDAIPISRLSLKSDKFDFKPANLAELLGLPKPWPPEF
jgi:hypothetical protein